MINKKAHRILHVITWAIKWFFPCIYHAVYKVDGKREVSIWKSWFGITMWEHTFEIINAEE